MLGRRYLVEHCISVYNSAQKKEIFETYVTDVLRVMANMKAKELTQNNQTEVVNIRYYDLVRPANKDKRTGEEIAADIIKGAGLVLEGD